LGSHDGFFGKSIHDFVTHVYMCRIFNKSYKIQELSYRKQIARKLRTQYVEGI